MQQYFIITFYCITHISNPQALRVDLLMICNDLDIKGTVIVSDEGINTTLSGKNDDSRLKLLQDRLLHLKALNPNNESIDFRISYAAFLPFQKLKIKIKPELVTFKINVTAKEKYRQHQHHNCNGIATTKAVISCNIKQTNINEKIDQRLMLRKDIETGEYLTSENWDLLLKNKEAIIIDTRNYYEVVMGKFLGAIDPKIANFSQLVDWIDQNLSNLDKNKTIVGMYCTGGIRCEKSTAYLKYLGFKNVYHLKGGILQYIEEFKDKENSNWKGELFVFDDRIAINKKLEPISTPASL